MTQYFRRTCLAQVALAGALVAAPAIAGSLPLPTSNTLDFNGNALSVVNTHVFGGAPNPVPSALRGGATGAAGIGVLGYGYGTSGTGLYGLAAGANGIGVRGIYDGTGSGSAAVFQNTNARNVAPAVVITSSGPKAYALKVVSSGADPLVSTGAGYFQINSPQAQFGSYAIEAIHSGGQTSSGSNGRYGSAGFFAITNTNNFDSALVGQTKSEFGTGVEADDFSSAGGVAILGQSNQGLSAQFAGGSGGSGICSYDGSSGFNCPSDRNLKEHFEAADLPDVLDKLGTLPMFYYRMKHSQAPTRYLGPTAQDFKAAFGLGKNDTTINTANAQGVALAAAKGLYEKLKTDEATIAVLKARVAQLEAESAKVAALETQMRAQGAALTRLDERLAATARAAMVRQASAAP